MIAKRLLTTLVAVLALAACSDDGTGPEDEIAIEGIYALQTVDGDPLPVTYTADTISQSYNSGNLLVNVDGTFVLSLNMTLKVGSQSATQTFTFPGEWIENNRALILLYDDGGAPDAGTLAGRNFYISLLGSAFVFRRQ
jgi:hypothetical protein